MLDYALPEEQQTIRELARTIADKEIRPVAAEYDVTGEFPWPIVKTLAEADLFRVFIDDAYGGMSFGSGTMNMVLVTEELSKACGGIALSFASSALGAIPIILSGSEELKQRFLPDLAEGKKLAAFALTEPQAGSDAGGIRTTALRDGDHYVLNGTKQWITNGGEAEIYSVRQERGQDGYPRLSYSGVDLRGLQGARREPDRARGNGVHYCDADLRRLAAGCWRPGAGHRAGSAAGSAGPRRGLCAFTQAVWVSGQLVPGTEVPYGRHGHEGGSGTSADLRDGATHRL